MNISKSITTGMTAMVLVASMAASVGATAAIKSTGDAVRVDISDLDVTTTDGRAMMEHRLKRAAKEVCGSQDVKRAGSLANARANRACFNESLSQAINSVESRYMTAYVDVTNVEAFNAR